VREREREREREKDLNIYLHIYIDITIRYVSHSDHPPLLLGSGTPNWTPSGSRTRARPTPPPHARWRVYIYR